MRILLTRPEPQAAGTAARLVAAGHTVVAAPMLVVVPEPEAAIDLAGVDGLAVTSRSAIDVLAGRPELPALLGLPLFAVGTATAAAAKAAGFRDVRVAGGDVAALAEVISSSWSTAAGDVPRPARGERGAEPLRGRVRGPETATAPGVDARTLLHLAGRDRAGDLTGALSAHGIAVRVAVVYRAETAPRLPADAAADLAAERLGAVLVYSARTAGALVAAAAGAGLSTALKRLPAVAISAAAGAPLTAAGMDVTIAASPDEPGMFAALAGLAGRPGEG